MLTQFPSRANLEPLSDDVDFLVAMAEVVDLHLQTPSVGCPDAGPAGPVT